MTLRYLLDTNIVSVPISKQPIASVVSKLNRRGAECAIGAPVWHELVYGCARLPAGKRRQAIERYLDSVVRASFPILPYDDACASRHATERARLEAAGTPAPFVDGQIAAIALNHDLILVTRDAAGFRSFPGLRVEDWS